VNVAIFRLTVRQLLRGKRALGLAAIPLAPAAVAVLRAAVSGPVSSASFYARLVEQLFLPTVVAFVALVLGASALGDEREDGTVLYLAATPLQRRSIVAAKVAGAWVAVLCVCLPALAVCLVFGLRGALTASAALWSLAAVLLGALAYCALFCWLSLRVRRCVLVGLLYIVLWEGSVAAFAPSAHWLSIGAYARVLAASGLPPETAHDVPSLAAGPAVVVLLAGSALLWLLAARRLARVELP
jgi:ABC-2 type transport system permease protein